MLKYVINKMAAERKESLGNILFVSCILAVLEVCFHVMDRIGSMVENDWYKNSMEVSFITDPFIREKMGAILWAVLLLLGIITLFCLVLYALKQKMDYRKEERRIALFQVLGYTGMRRAGAWYVGKLTELVAASVVGSGMGFGIWTALGRQKNFHELMTMMNENLEFHPGIACMNVLALALLGLAVTCRETGRKTNMAVMLKGAENE